MASGYKLHGVDLDDIFAPRGATTARANTGYRVAGVDIAQRYMATTGGDLIGFNTGYKVAGVDIATMFRSISYAPTFPPTITSNPSSTTVNSGSFATFSVSASGTAPLSYQWQRNLGGGYSNISGGTGSTFGISTQVSDSGQYRCVVTNAYGTATSSAATLTVTPQVVVIDTHPSGMTVNDGDLAALQCFAHVASPDGPVYFSWYHGPSMVNAPRLGNLSSGAGDQHAITWHSADAGPYECRCSTPQGAISTSSSATVVVNP